ncbi:MAG: hypothetical protein AAB521_00155 [Patescibacteria group bacterium]
MQDLGQEQNQSTQQEQRSPGGYIKLVHPQEEPESWTSSDGIKFVDFPKKWTSLGDARLELTRTNFEPYNPNEKAILVTDKGLQEITEGDALGRGLYDVKIHINHPIAKFRGSEFFAGVSIDGETDLIQGQFYNSSEDEEDYSKERSDQKLQMAGTELWDLTFEKDGKKICLYVPYESTEERRFVEDLYFRFTVAHPPREGKI